MEIKAYTINNYGFKTIFNDFIKIQIAFREIKSEGIEFISYQKNERAMNTVYWFLYGKKIINNDR